MPLPATPSTTSTPATVRRRACVLVVAALVVVLSVGASTVPARAQAGPGLPGSVSGRVTDLQGRPLPGISVGVRTACGDGVVCETVSAVTGADGSYRISPLLGVVDQVTFQDPLLIHAYAVRTDVGEVARDEHVTGVDAVLAPGATVSGRVVHGTDPLPGAVVRTRVTSSTPLAVSTVSAADGSFVLAGLPTGPASVLASVGVVSSPAVDLPSIAPAAPATGVVLAMTDLATVSGVVVDQVTGRPLTDVAVNGARSDGAGRYLAYVGVALADTPVSLRVDPGRFHLPPVGGVALTLSPGQQVTGRTIAVVPRAALAAPPPGTVVDDATAGPGGVPGLGPLRILEFSTTGCPGGTATYSVVDLSPAPGVAEPDPRVDQPLPETPVGSGTYRVEAGRIDASGEFTVQVRIDCPGATPDQATDFGLYVDPSGTVVDTAGAPIAGATVTLLRSESAAGPFHAVPNGSVIMSPDNRANPVVTGSDGAFAWFTTTGVYRVRAERAGCHAPGNPAVLSVETPSLPVPPEWLGLVLTLECPAPGPQPIPYVAVTPARLLDTRPGQPTIDGAQSGAGPLPAGGRLTLPVAGRYGLPANGVAAVVLNVTTTGATAPSFVTVWPSGTPMPTASSLNTEPGQDTPNLVITRLSPGGSVDLYNDAGTTDLVADIVGWYPTGTSYVALSPARLLDTRSGSPTVDGGSAGVGPLAAGTALDLHVAGRAGLPATGVGAVVLNVTATGSSAPSYVTAWPTGTPRPTASNLNTEPGQDTPNLVVVGVGSTGDVSLYNDAGTTDLVADIVGWYPALGPAPAALTVQPLTFAAVPPARLLDTRPGQPTVDAGNAGGGAVDGGTSITLPVAGRAGLPPTGVAAVVLNVTATASTAPSFVTVWPTGAPMPTASSLNTEPGQDTPNLVVAKLGATGEVSLYNDAGTTHLVADVVGWYPAPR